MELNPIFLHIEVSNANLPSFPTEIYWGTIPNKGSAGYLINPEGIARWQSWNTEFYDLHHITQEDLRIYGSHPSIICEAINRQLSGKTIYAKKIEETERLITELFLAGDMQPCEIIVLELDEWFLELIKTKQSGNADEILKQVKIQIAKEHPHYLCGGVYETLYYSEVWKLIDSNKIL